MTEEKCPSCEGKQTIFDTQSGNPKPCPDCAPEERTQAGTQSGH